MDTPEKIVIDEMVGADKAEKSRSLMSEIERLYEMETAWNKGFGDWIYEYKYRRGGKTLCTFYFKQNIANILIILGKAEREKLEQRRSEFSEQLMLLYDETPSYHDGKWLWIPIDAGLSSEDIIELLKIKRRPNRK